MNNIVRLSKIEINNFKNVVKGSLSFNNPRKDYKASILGLYGQNGSGKTTLIDSIELLKNVLSGSSIDNKYADYINVDSQESNITYCFDLYNGKDHLDIEYTICLIVDLGNNDNIETTKRLVIKNELIKCPILSDKRIQKGKLIDTNTKNLFIPVPKKQLLIGSDKDKNFELLVAKKMCEAQSRSFVFSNELIKEIENNNNNESEKEEINYYLTILKALKNYGMRELFVINRATFGLISLNAQPLMFKYKDEQIGAIGGLMFPLDEPCVVRKKDINITKKVINNMNLVLKQIVPGLTISLKELGTQLMEDGDIGQRIQFMSNKNSKDIPLGYESEGIKKIVSILQLLIVVFNEESVTVVIDELDSGVFEYLLGEILSIIAEKGKGQLIFTSHNLRPLETLDRGFVAFTTTNPENRYTRISGVKDTNNLRDLYYRDIMLGISDEELYDHTKNSEITFAFMEAGKFNNG